MNEEKSNKNQNLNIDFEKIKKRSKKTKKIAQKAINEYKDFAMKSNIVDLAIGVVIGSAFTSIVNALVSNLITPLLSILTSKVDLSTLFISLDGKFYSTIEQAKQAGAITINYGAILNAILNFFIISVILFIVFKYINKIRKHSEDSQDTIKKATTKVCPYCLSNIPINATKCAYCTSDQPIEEDIQK